MRSFEFARKIVDGVVTDEKAYKDAQIPEYQTRFSAGADFFCAERVTIPSMWGMVNPKPVLVHTGIKADMEDDEVLEVYNRSSNPKKGLVLANSVGIIDKDYYNNPSNDGEIMFAFYNYHQKDLVIETGERIGQGIFKKYLRPTDEAHGLRIKDNDRLGGIGSTDQGE